MPYAIGIDVGGTTIKSGVVGADGSLQERSHTPTPRNLEEFANKIAVIVSQIDQRIHLAQPHLADQIIPTIGLVIPGIVDEPQGRVSVSVNLGWYDVPVQAFLEKRLQRPVRLGHDVRCGALAESRWGAGSANCLFIALGTGMSAGLILNGKAIAGGGLAGEIGQVVVPVSPAPNLSSSTAFMDEDTAISANTLPGVHVSSQVGTQKLTGMSMRDAEYLPLEQLCSASAIIRRFHQICPNELSADAGAREVFALMGSNASADMVISQAINALASTIAHCTALLGPIDVVIGGGLIGAGEVLLEPVRREVPKYLGVLTAPRILAAQLGSWAQTLGSGALALGAEGQLGPTYGGRVVSMPGVFLDDSAGGDNISEGTTSKASPASPKLIVTSNDSCLPGGNSVVATQQ